MSDLAVREHVIYLLEGGGAHPDFEAAVEGIPPALWGATLEGTPHTLWRLLEHLRICQWDILEFSRNADYKSPDWPAGYWPAGNAPPDDLAWDRTVQAFRDDRQAMVDLVRDPATDLYAAIPHGDGQTILREALLVADHNAYHVGQLIFLRKCLEANTQEAAAE